MWWSGNEKKRIKSYDLLERMGSKMAMDEERQ